MSRPRILLAATLAAATLSACGSNDSSTNSGGPSTPAPRTAESKGRAEIRDVDSIDQLQTLFNAQSEKPRLILLASPT